MEQSKLMAKLAYKALDDRKGEDIKIIDISNISVGSFNVSKYFCAYKAIFFVFPCIVE